MSAEVSVHAARSARTAPRHTAQPAAPDEPRTRAAGWLTAAVLACLAALPATASGEYRTVTVDGLRVTIDSDWAASRGGPGYLPVRFDIFNPGEERVIEIVGNGQQMYSSGGRYSVRRLGVRQRVRLPAAGRARLTLPLPINTQASVQLRIEQDGEILETLGFSNTPVSAEAPVLIVVAQDSAYRDAAAGWVRPTSYVTGAGATIVRPVGALPPIDTTLEPARMPTSWLGFTTLEAMMAGPAEWKALDDEQRAAVLTWVAAGGQLILVDADLSLLFPDPRQRAGAHNGAARHFFGHIYLQTAEDITTRGLPDVLQSMRTVIPGSGTSLSAGTMAASEALAAPVFWLPVPDIGAIPARIYVGILVLFAVIIGPLNHIVLKRRGLHALLVLTTPLIAGAFIVLLAGYVVVVEGFGVSGRVISLTRLDESRSQAATHTMVSMYAAGAAPSGGLQFARDVAVFPGAGNGDLRLDLTTAQMYQAGLVAARTPANLETIAVRTARERLRVRSQNGSLTAVNGLDATVTRLLYRTDGQTYTIDGPLAPGASGTLQATSLTGLDLLPTDVRFSHLDTAVENQPDGSYLAVLDRSPFAETGVPDIEERGSFHLVLGTTEGQP